MDWDPRRWRLYRAGKSKEPSERYLEMLTSDSRRRFNDKYLVVGKLVPVSEGPKDAQ